MSGKSSGKEKLIDEEEEVLQAVILADSFNKRFRPLTTKKPRVSLNLFLLCRKSDFFRFLPSAYFRSVMRLC